MASPNLIPYGQPLPAPSDIDARDEMNLAEFPITLLSFRNTSKNTVLEFVQKARHPETGAEIDRVLTIDAGRSGLPTATDEEVLLMLIQTTKARNGFSAEKVHFSPYELLKLLKWDTNSRAYRQLHESLQRWTAVRLSYKNAWYDNAAKSWVSADFSVLTNLFWYDGEPKPKRVRSQQSLPFSNFTWNQVIFDSFKNGYLKRLDYGFYIGLRHPIARRIYRFMDKRFYRSPTWRFDLVEFAYNHVGLSEGSGRSTVGADKQGYTNVNKIKKKLEPGLIELEEKGFLAPLTNDARFKQLRRGWWEILLVKSKPEEKSLPQGASLAQTLIDRGVTAKTADELVATYSAEAIERQIDVLQWMQERPAGEEVQNPPAWLTAAIRGDYAPPTGYLPKAEREFRRETSAKAKARLQREEADKHQKAREERENEQARRDHINKYLDAMTETERQSFEMQAFITGDEMQQRVIRQKEPGAAIIRRLLIEAEVLRVSPCPQSKR